MSKSIFNLDLICRAAAIALLGFVGGVCGLTVDSAFGATKTTEGTYSIDALADRLDRVQKSFSGFSGRSATTAPDIRSAGSRPEPNARAAAHKRIVVAQSLAGLSVRMDRLEAQMRRLTGQLEDLNYQLETMRMQNRRLSEDNEMRFQELEDHLDAAPRKKKSQAPVQENQPNRKASIEPQQRQTARAVGVESSNTIELLPAGRVEAPLDDARARTSLQPVDIAELVRRGSPSTPRQAPDQEQSGLPATTALATLSPRQAYSRAYGLITRRRWSQAEEEMTYFIDTFPTHQLAGNAYYWLGETHYARGDFAKAVRIFAQGYERHGASDKGPDLLLKLGMSLARSGRTDRACTAYRELRGRYRNLSPIMKNHLATQRSYARCR